MTRDLYALSARLQEQILQASSSLPAATWARAVPRVLLDSWASLVRWHESGERVRRIGAAAAAKMGDMVLPGDLPLATAPVHAEAVCYQLPDRTEWIVLARHAPAPREVVVHGDVRWSYAQPVLTYCTDVEGRLAAGYYSLADYPTAGSLPPAIQAGTSLGPAGVRSLSEIDVMEEDSRVALALLHYYIH